jgi:hypothetical protein
MSSPERPFNAMPVATTRAAKAFQPGLQLAAVYTDLPVQTSRFTCQDLATDAARLSFPVLTTAIQPPTN